MPASRLLVPLLPLLAGCVGLGLADDVLEDAAFLVAGAAEAFVGHPWRWSPVQVELALTQRIPWATDATDETLRAVEQVLPDAKVELKRLAGALVRDERPGDWAQALMAGQEAPSGASSP